MAQERKKELVDADNALSALSSEFLSHCSDEELKELRIDLELKTGVISSILRTRPHCKTHFPKKENKNE